MKPTFLFTYQGPAGDHNDLARAGARIVGEQLASLLHVEARVVGAPGPVLNSSWREELHAARNAFDDLSAAFDEAIAAGARPVCALTRCAAALATLPVVVRHRPDACVVWFDAHGDLNTPETSVTGYLGGMAIAGAAGLWDSGLAVACRAEARGAKAGGLSLDQVVLVGTRDVDPGEQALIDTSGVRVVPVCEDVGDMLRRAVAGRDVFVHVDCDVLDAGIMPTDYAVAGGLTLRQLREACTALSEVDPIGLEIAEFQEAHDETGRVLSPAPLLDALAPLLARFVTR